MSTVFTGIFLKNMPEAIEEYAVGHPLNGDLSVSLMRPGLTVVFVRFPRRAWHGAKLEELASNLSIKFSFALLVAYDSRCSFRESAVYAGGVLKNRFGEDDELFVPLGDDGLPVLDATPRKLAEFIANEEHETILNAIQLGFSSFGDGSWAELTTFIGRL